MAARAPPLKRGQTFTVLGQFYGGEYWTKMLFDRTIRCNYIEFACILSYCTRYAVMSYSVMLYCNRNTVSSYSVTLYNNNNNNLTFILRKILVNMINQNNNQNSIVSYSDADVSYPIVILIENWRPISLINVDVKVILVLATRIKNVLLSIYSL